MFRKKNDSNFETFLLESVPIILKISRLRPVGNEIYIKTSQENNHQQIKFIVVKLPQNY